MRFQGAVIKEQGVTFAIVIFKNHVLSSNQQSQSAINSFSGLFPGMPVVLMAQDNCGIPSYYGRKDLVNFLSKIHISRIPWREYSVN